MSKPTPSPSEKDLSSALRIPPPSEEDLSPALREALGELPPLNLFRVLANAPASFQQFLDMGGSILFRSEFDPKKRELAILRVAHTTGSQYEWAQHEPFARSVGATDEELRAVATDGPVNALDEEGNLLCRVADEISRDVRLSDEALAQIIERYGNRGATELILCCSWFNLVSRFLESARVPLEE